MHGDVVGMEGRPVGTERQDRVGLDLVEQPRDQGEPLGVMVGEGAVGQSEETMVPHTEYGHGGGRFPAAHPAEP